MSSTDTDTDLEKVKIALGRERLDNKSTRELLKASREKVTTLEQQLAEAAVAATPTTKKVADYLNAAVQVQLAAATSAQLGRIAALEAELAEARGASDGLKATIVAKGVEDALREAAARHHVRSEAVADIITLGKLVLTTNERGEIVTGDGLTAFDWLDARKAESPYWWEPGRGSGWKHHDNPKPHNGGMSPVGSNLMGPGVGGNPFDPAASAFNVTEQGRIFRENPALAAELKQRAGQK